MVLYKYFKKAPSALPNPNGTWIVRLWKRFLQLIAKCRDWFTNTLVSLQRKAFLPPSQGNPYPGTRVPSVGRGWYAYNVIMEARVLCYVSLSLPLRTVFAKILFAELNIATDSRNIYGGGGEGIAREIYSKCFTVYGSPLAYFQPCPVSVHFTGWSLSEMNSCRNYPPSFFKIITSEACHAKIYWGKKWIPVHTYNNAYYKFSLNTKPFDRMLITLKND